MARVRRIVKWGGLVATVLVAGAYVASVWWTVAWSSAYERGVGVGRGAVALLWRFPLPRLLAMGDDPYLDFSFRDPGLSISTFGFGFCWWPFKGRASHCDYVAIPLWMPLVLIAAPTVWLW
jgi:hypothetical protein